MQRRLSSAELAANRENHSQLALVKQALLQASDPFFHGLEQKTNICMPLILCFVQSLKSQATSLVIDSTHNMIRSASVTRKLHLDHLAKG